MHNNRLDQADEPSSIPVGMVPTVGRDRELAQIRRLVHEAAGGETRVLLLSGEAGIGKSRLLADAMQCMREDGGIAVLGRCLDERGAPPFFPWIDALTQLDEQLHSREQVTGAPVAGELAPILLDVGSSERFIPDAVAAEQRAFRQVVSLSRALAGAARSVPVLIGFDDLQWADPASNQLLRYVAASLTDARVAIIGAYRTGASRPSHDLSRTVDELDRRRLATTIHLLPMSEAATAQLVRGLLGRAKPALSRAIHQQSEGNPFAIEEIARAIAADPRVSASMLEPAWRPEPAGVLTMLRRRIEPLAPATRDLLDIAALTGREVSIDLVRRVSGLDPDSLAASFDEITGAGLLDTVPEEPDRAYRFRHDRVREAVAALIAPVRKQALHARLAAAIEATDGLTDPLERTALLLHHRLKAGEREQAAMVAERLGSEAMRAHAFQQAAAALDTALGLRRAAPSGVSAWDEGRLLLLRGDALLAASDPEAITVLAEAERCASASGDQALLARAQLRRGRAHARREEHELAVAALRSAIASFATIGSRDHEAQLAEVELVALLGTSLGAYDEAIEIGERALAAVTLAPGDPALEAAVRLELAKTLMRTGNLGAGHAHLVPALGLALGAGSLELAAEISGALANHAYWTARLDLSERAARNRREYATQAGDPFALRHARSWLANISIARGDWAVARGLIADATADVERIDSPEPAAFLHHLSGMIALSLGQLDEAISCFEAAMSGFRQVGAAALPWYLGLLAHAYQAAGDQTAAQAAVRETEEIITAMPVGSLPAAAALAQLGIVATLRDDQAAAERLYPALLPYQGQFHWVLIDRVLGMLARTRGDAVAASRHRARAAAIALREGLRPEHALSMASQAVASARSAPGERSRAEIEQAIARLRALGMEGAIRQLERLAISRPEAKSAGNPASLTDRELDVLRLLARGMTNREIGEHLHISEKTVVNHITRIYAKAGIENRAGAVMFAVRHGLATG